MVCPSGMPLARSMAAFAPRKGDGLVVELGAGTGTVTRQLLDAGIAPRRLVVVEQSPVMVGLLRERFPQLACGLSPQRSAGGLHRFLPAPSFPE